MLICHIDSHVCKSGLQTPLTIFKNCWTSSVTFGNRQKALFFMLACVASVSMGFGNKERPRNGIFGVFPARKMGREPKSERGGRGRGRKETNLSFPPPSSPSFLFLAHAPFFARPKNRKSRSSDIPCSTTPRTRLLFKGLYLIHHFF